MQVQECLHIVRAAVHAIWPRAATHIFGSQAVDLAMPGSDVDIVILGVVSDLPTADPAGYDLP